MCDAVINATITGVGASLPNKVLTNFDLEKIVDTTDEWITTRTGINERRIAEDDVFTSDLASKASIEAINDAGLTPSDIDLIIVATITPDMCTPAISCIVQKNINAQNAATFDVNAACSGFVYGLTIANQFIKTGYYKNVLVIGADCLSKVTNWKDRNTCVLFGDGAGAVVVSATHKNEGILSTYIGADGTMGDVLTLPAFNVSDEEKEKRVGDNYKTIWMDGQEVFKFAVKIMADATNKALEKVGLTISDVDMIVPHQANMRIVDGATKRLKVNKDKVFTNLQKYGNMSAASIPVALYECYKEGHLKNGNNVVLVGFGGGLTWASTLIKWGKN